MIRSSLRYLELLFILCSVVSSSFATNINIDGLNDFNAATDMITNDQTAAPQNNPEVSKWYYQWNDTYLFLGVEGSWVQNITANNVKWTQWYFDINPQETDNTGSGSNIGYPGSVSGVTVTLPFKADHFLRIQWITDLYRFVSEFYSWNGSTWNLTYDDTVVIIKGGVADSYVEVAIPFSAFPVTVSNNTRIHIASNYYTELTPPSWGCWSPPGQVAATNISTPAVMAFDDYVGLLLSPIVQPNWRTLWNTYSVLSAKSGQMDFASTWYLAAGSPQSHWNLIGSNAGHTVTLNSTTELTVRATTSALGTLKVAGNLTLNTKAWMEFPSGGVFDPQPGSYVTVTANFGVSGTSNNATFQELVLNGRAQLEITTNIKTRLNLRTGSSVTAGPTYASGSELFYGSGGNYTRTNEWLPAGTTGYPYDLRVGASTTLPVGNGGWSTNVSRIFHSLTVDSGSTLDFLSPTTTRNTSVGGNLTSSCLIRLSNLPGSNIIVSGSIQAGTVICPGGVNTILDASGNPFNKPVIYGNSSFEVGKSAFLSTVETSDSYSWSNGQTSQSILVNSAGSYTVTVTTANGCTAVSNPFTVIMVSPSPSVTPTSSVTPTVTPSKTPTPSVSPTTTPSASVSPTATPSASVTPSPGVSPSTSPSSSPSLTPTPSASVTPTVTPTASVTASTSVTPTPTPSSSTSPSSSPESTNSSDNENADSNLSTASITAIAIIIPVGCCCIILVAFFVINQKLHEKRRQNKPPVDIETQQQEMKNFDQQTIGASISHYSSSSSYVTTDASSSSSFDSSSSSESSSEESTSSSSESTSETSESEQSEIKQVKRN